MLIELLGDYGWPMAVAACRLSWQPGGDALKPMDADDLDLLSRLVKAGDDHAKCLRMVMVWQRVRAPRYWWQEFDTYKVGVTTCSESTMHTLMRRELGSLDFADGVLQSVISSVNTEIRLGNHGRAKANLPEGFLQTRISVLNYQVLRTIYKQRRTHKLREWQEYCDWIETLPHAGRLITP